MARPTVREIAAEAGVSIATVSRVMTGKAPVAPETQELVHQAVERLGVRARRPVREGGIFVRCPYVLTDYFGIIVSSIAETLDLHHRRLILNAGEASQETPALQNLSRDPAVAGAILILPPEPDEELRSLRSQGFPFVVVDPRTTLPADIASVSAAHSTGARSVTAHLTALGHRRIGFIGGPTEWLSSQARLVGHTSALADVGVLPEPDLLRSVEPTTEQGYRAAASLLDQRPTALAGFNDKIAVGALRAAHERGLRVPADLSITGFDDSDISRSTTPELTTVRQPLEEMGRIAVSLLLRLIDRHTVDALHIELGTYLVKRASTAAVSQVSW